MIKNFKFVEILKNRSKTSKWNKCKLNSFRHIIIKLLKFIGNKKKFKATRNQRHSK
jgi:hypothetical protein